MKTYEGYDSSPDGWNVSSTLELEDDGRFTYSEGWTDYTNASLSGGAGGTWRRGDGVIFFRAERVYPPLYFPWEVGRELMVTVRGDALVFAHGSTLREPCERADLVYEPKPPAPPKSPPPPVKPPAPPAVETESAPPLKPPRYVPPRVNPFPISPGLAARLRSWIEELPTEGLGNWVKRLCKQYDALPLHSTQFLMWALRTDGQVLVIDHESASQSVDPEIDDARAYAALAQGASAHPELAELLANNPEGVLRCLYCDGKGQMAAKPPAKGMSPCSWCYGMGWRNSAA